MLSTFSTYILTHIFTYVNPFDTIILSKMVKIKKRNFGNIKKCSHQTTPRQTLFFRMDISPDGKIRSYYATFQSGDFHPIECNEEAE